MSGDQLITKDIHLIQEQVLHYHDVFSLEGEYGKADTVKHHANTEVYSPINQPLRCIPYALHAEMLKLVQSMLENNVVQPSVSPWSSPVVLVKKKDSILRFCIDYCRLNSITRRRIFNSTHWWYAWTTEGKESVYNFRCKIWILASTVGPSLKRKNSFSDTQ